MAIKKTENTPLLSILIPTYNRCLFLERNLNSLSEIINLLSFNNLVEVVVSDNCSSDGTHNFLSKFIIRDKSILIKSYRQNLNIGLEKNSIFVLQKARGAFVMYLGDDDYIQAEYLRQVMENLRLSEKLRCIIPNFELINKEGKKLGYVREERINSRTYEAGFRNCLRNSWKGHQLSGLVLHREELLKDYYSRGINNIYLFIFFVAQSCLKGATLNINTHPVSVTHVDQNEKDWTYGEDGLFNEIFDNYNRLELNILARTLLQLKFFHVQPERLFNQRLFGFKRFTRSFLLILKSKNSTVLFKFLFPFSVLFIYFISRLKCQSKGR